MVNIIYGMLTAFCFFTGGTMVKWAMGYPETLGSTLVVALGMSYAVSGALVLNLAMRNKLN